jgi:uncharacterized membrane protein YdbT with pleckstrin-like domain
MNQDEPIPTIEIMKPIRRNIVLLGIRMFLVLFMIDTVYAFLILIPLFGYVASDWHMPYVGFLLVIHTLKNGLTAYMLISLVTNWISTLYYVNGGHLIRQRGVLNTKETVYQLTDIEEVVMNQSWLGRLLNFGDITITFLVARQREDLVLYAINNPRMYEELFSKFV